MLWWAWGAVLQWLGILSSWRITSLLMWELEREKAVGKELILDSPKAYFASYFVLFFKSVSVISLLFGSMPYASSHWKPSMSREKKFLQLVEVLFCFYFGGLKLITDSGLCLHVQNEMRVWANCSNNEERKIHFSFHYLKISGICSCFFFLIELCEKLASSLHFTLPV